MCEWGQRVIEDSSYQTTARAHCSTLDKYVMDNNIEVGLIKVDIEGYESKFLTGAINTIKSQKPVLMISIYHNFNDFFKIKPFIEEISNDSYSFRFVHPVLTKYARCEIMLIGEPKV